LLNHSEPSHCSLLRLLLLQQLVLPLTLLHLLPLLLLSCRKRGGKPDIGKQSIDTQEQQGPLAAPLSFLQDDWPPSLSNP
jgi:hypothetical protein